MRESVFQAQVVRELKDEFPGCYVLKNDPEYQQGFPDLLVLYRNKWAALELKGDAQASHQPNQDYFVQLLDGMSFGSFLYPENHDEILDELRQHFTIA